MKFYKVAIIVLIVALLVIIKFYFFAPKAKLTISSENIKLTDNTLSLPLEVWSNKDAIYKFRFKIHHGTKKIDLPQTYVIALKKGQGCKLNFQLQETQEVNFKHLKPKFILETTLEEIFPKTKKFTKLTVVKVSTEKIHTIEISTPQPVAPFQPPLEKEKQVVSTEKKVEIVEQPKIDYLVTIDTETIKSKYRYGEKIQVSLKLNNKSIKTSITSNITSYLKNISGIVVSSTGTSLSLKPLEVKNLPLEFTFTEELLPDFYYLESIVVINSKQHSYLTNTFQLVDSTPVITLHEIPTIKYGQTNTIIAEVEDDRGVTEVKFVQFDPKHNLRNEHQMILIAGSKKTGLYSFTTEKIKTKGYFSFYIQAMDVSGNIAQTDVFNIKISK